MKKHLISNSDLYEIHGIRLYGVIYLITNLHNGKVYVGQMRLSKSRSLRRRWWEHKHEASKLKRERENRPGKKINSRHLYNAMVYYGFKTFNITVINIAYNKEELNDKEEYYIGYYRDKYGYQMVYNETDGGDSGYELSEKSKEKIKRKVIELKNDPEYMRKWKEGMERTKHLRNQKRKLISNNKTFFKDLMEMSLNDLMKKYNIGSHHTIMDRIQEKLGKEITGLRKARIYLKEHPDLIGEEKIEHININIMPERKKIKNQKEFKIDLMKMTIEELERKYKMKYDALRSKIEKILNRKINGIRQARQYFREYENEINMVGL